MTSSAPARSTRTRHSSFGPTSLIRPTAAAAHRLAPVDDDVGLTGRYRLDPRTTAWWWSPEMYALLGLPPEDTCACTEALLQCEHREDRDVAQGITASASGHASLPADLRAILRDACPPAPA